ncbi:IS1/IS1595 family N-terminal zinc-binding domain-containing protein [Nostoc sp.]
MGKILGVAMQCPRCASTHLRKNGRQRGKQNYIQQIATSLREATPR